MTPKAWRIRENLTLAELSARMGGVATGYLSEIERGLKSPSGRILTLYHKISRGRVTPSDFLPETTEKHPPDCGLPP